MEIFSLNYPDDEDVHKVDSCLDHYYASILNDGNSTAICYEEQDSITFNDDNDVIFLDHKQQRQFVHNLVFQRKNYTNFLMVWQRKSTTHPYLNSTFLKVLYGKERKEH